MQGHEEGADFLRLDDADIADVATGVDATAEGDPFGTQLVTPHMPIVADEAALRDLGCNEVLVRRWPNANLPAQYFRNMDPDVHVVVAPCGHAYLALEYALLCLSAGRRPFTREAFPSGGVDS